MSVPILKVWLPLRLSKSVERVDELDFPVSHEPNEIFSDLCLILDKAAQCLVFGRGVDTWPKDEFLGREKNDDEPRSDLFDLRIHFSYRLF